MLDASERGFSTGHRGDLLGIYETGGAELPAAMISAPADSTSATTTPASVATVAMDLD